MGANAKDVLLLASLMSVAGMSVMIKSASSAGIRITTYHTINTTSKIGKRGLTVVSGKWTTQRLTRNM